jgi:hypothetical protein
LGVRDANATQVRAARKSFPDLDAYGIYWDDVVQRFFYRLIENKRQKILEAPIKLMPANDPAPRARMGDANEQKYTNFYSVEHYGQRTTAVSGELAARRKRESH